MNSMKSRILRSLFLVISLPIVAAGLHGCRKAPKLSATNAPDIGKVDPNAGDKVFVEARDAFRLSRPADDWTRFRDFLPKFNSHFARAEVQSRLQLTAAERKYLSNDVHLTAAEITDLEASEFRPADAHYLDECYLLRDAAQALESAALDTPEKQARALFGWTTRNVLLHEAVDSWIPPAFTLRRGYGSALERSLVYLALLRQQKLDGCLIVVPDSEPLQFLIGVLDAKSSSVLLFDARLGLPVAGKDGKSIATLKDALADPKLLEPARITPEQAKKLEAWLVCPYHALSPRMQELQEQLGRLDRVALYQNPLALAQEMGKLTEIPVKAWNPPAQVLPSPPRKGVGGDDLANSPTRCLNLFLPKSEGGLDAGARTVLFQQSRLPMGSFMVNLGQINVTRQYPSAVVFRRLSDIAVSFLVKCDLQPRELYLHGQYEAMRQRQERIIPLTKTDAFIGDKAFEEERVKWFKEMNAALTALEDDNAATKAKAQHTLETLGGTDFVLHWMLDMEGEKKLADLEKELRDANVKGGQPRSVPTKILAVGLRDHFDFELARSQASVSQEKAERAQAILRAQAKPSDQAAKRASDAWIVAKSAWANFYVNRIPLETTIEQRLEQIRKRVRAVARSQEEELELRVSLLELLHLDIARYFNAKLRVAECLVHTHPDGVKGAYAYLEKTKVEIENMEKKGLLRDEVRGMRDLLPQAPLAGPVRALYENRLELLSRDWSERGSYSWMKQQIDQRVK